MKFSIRRNKDSSLAFEQALLEAGHRPVARPEEADFILFDSENVGRRREELKALLEHRPGFIYPHTPFTCWLWDGVYEPLPAACNFVAALAQKEAMQVYRYPYRVEPIGFPRCDVLPFQPTSGRNLLFVPARPRRDDGRQAGFDANALQFVVEHRARFESVTVCHVGQYDGYHMKGVTFLRYDIKALPSPTANMMELVDQADVIISCNTPAALGVARGKPTIMYGEMAAVPQTNTGRAPLHYDQYSHLLRYPLLLEDMTIDDVFTACSRENESVETWKTGNIGGNFNAEQFIKIVEEYL
jgi:hypothetical protein